MGKDEKVPQGSGIDDRESLDVAEEPGGAEAADEAPHVTKTAASRLGTSPATAINSPMAKQQPAALALLLAGGAAVALVALLVKRLQKRWRGVQQAQLRQEQVFSTLVHLPPPSVPPPPSSVLAGRTFVVSDRVDIQSVETRFGSNAWKRGRQPSQHSSPIVDLLLSHGGQCKAVVLSDPLGLGPLLLPDASGVPNPAGRGHHHGGGEFGAAACAAASLADLALAVDELGSSRVPAAACGVYALRPTAGVLPLEGSSTASHSLAVPALLAADPGLLLRAGQALRLPAASTGELAQYLVAEDYFASCGEEMRAALPAVVAAVKRWAGPDQAQGLSLCEWIYHRVQSLRAFMPASEASSGSAAPRKHTRAVLAALAAVAETIRQWEFCQLHGDWVAAQDPSSLEQEVLAYWREARQVTQQQYRSAAQVAAELSTSMRGALQEGYIFVLPTAPGPAPHTDDGEGLAAFRRGAAEFCALAALAGVPQVVMPLPQAGGSLPLSVSLISLHKRDLTLLQAAAKLGPMLQQEAAKLAEQRSGGERQPGARSSSGGGGGAGPGGSAKGSGRSPKGKGKGRSIQQADQEVQAEAYKEEGNAAFKAGRYQDAIRQYSAAVQLNPRSAVYYNNRALAYLKLGDYGQAEADCDAALSLEISAKALLRRGSARLAQGSVEGARADFKQVLALEPQNRQAREELRGIVAMESASTAANGIY